jgi:hypothetical protein
MVLKETQLIITSGNATTSVFNPGASQGIPISNPAINYQLTSGNQTNPVYKSQPIAQPSYNNQRMGTPTGNANDFLVMLPHPFENVVKTEVRYFFLENGLSNVYSSSAATINSLNPDGNNLFTIGGQFGTGNSYLYTIKIPDGYYDRNALAEVILNLVNQIDFDVTGTVLSATYTVPSQSASNPIYNSSTASGFQEPATNFSACSISSDGIFRLEAASPTSIFYTSTDWAIGFLDTSTGGFYRGTSFLLGFQDSIESGLLPIVQPNQYSNAVILESPYTTTIDIYNYILVQSQKLGSRVVSTTGINAYCIIPMAGQNTQVASQTGQFTYDGGNFTLDASYFDFPRRLDTIDIRLADSSGALLDIGTNTVTLVLRIIQSVV